MKTAETRSPRGLKFAEAGILFILILGLTIFLGVRIASRGEPAGQLPAQTRSSTTESAPAAVAAALATEPTVADPAPDGTEAPAADLAAAPPRLVTYAEAEQAYLIGAYEEAADLFAAYAADRPGNAWGHYMLGLACWKAGDPEGAEEGFLAALQIRPDHVKSLINHGRVLLEMDRSEEARQQVEKALALEPDNRDARRVLGRAYHELGLLGEAEQAYRQVLAADARDAWALNNLGLILIQQERFGQALPALARAVQLRSGEACFQNNLGIALERTGYVDAAAQAFAKAAELDPDHAAALASLDRLQGRRESPDLEPFDLAAVADRFQARDEVALAAAAPQEEPAEAEDDGE